MYLGFLPLSLLKFPKPYKTLRFEKISDSLEFIYFGFSSPIFLPANPRIFPCLFLIGKILYGIDKFTNLKGSKPKYIFIVEGYTDVMMMNKFGIYNVVATMGTSLTIEHANELKKFSSKVIMCYDSDKAGFDSSFKSIEPLYQLGIEVYTLRLQSNYDPCSFIKEFGKAKFIDAAKNSTLIIEEYINYLKEEYLEKNISINEMVSSFILKVKFVQDPIQRDISINKFT